MFSNCFSFFFISTELRMIQHDSYNHISEKECTFFIDNCIDFLFSSLICSILHILTHLLSHINHAVCFIFSHISVYICTPVYMYKGECWSPIQISDDDDTNRRVMHIHRKLLSVLIIEKTCEDEKRNYTRFTISTDEGHWRLTMRRKKASIGKHDWLQKKGIYYSFILPLNLCIYSCRTDTKIRSK